jgi:signal transduction histidine kinase
LLNTTYDKYVAWTASVTQLKAQKEVDALKAQQAESQQIISERDSELSTRWVFIIGLCILAAVLIAALILCGMVLLRYIALTRKQKKAIVIAKEHNELKTQFIRNISAQVEPTLDQLDSSQPGVQALHEFSAHIQELSDLEMTLSEPYEMSEINVTSFCENVMDQIKPRVKAGVSTAVNAPKLSVRSNPEELERVLLHLLKNAAEYTPEGGKIWLDFKKRGAHVQQFIVSDTGNGIPEELRDNIFRPFTETKDLTQGDGLGLPICSLIAVKLNGSLTLDTSYTRGSRFVLELRT